MSLAQAQAPLPARDVEAAFLINFLRYTQWPEQSFASAQAPFVLTVMGPSLMATSVRALAQAAGTVNGRPIEVRWIDDGEASRDAEHAQLAMQGLHGCHLLFLQVGAAGLRRQALTSVAGEPVLTVADQPGFAAAGGMIELQNAAGHIVFKANPAAIRAAGLMVSAKVLKLAQTIQDDVR